MMQSGKSHKATRMCKAEKRALLLIDNFSAYELRVKQLVEKEELANTKVSIKQYLKKK